MGRLRDLRVYITTAGPFSPHRSLLDRVRSIGDPITVRDDAADADTDSPLTLVYRTHAGRDVDLRFPDLPYDQWENSRTDMYDFTVRGGDEIDTVGPEQFRIVNLGDDAWLPSSIFVLGSDGGAFQVLVARPSWPPNAWFSAQLSDADGRAAKARLLDVDATPTVG